jgi:NAD kinase
LSKGVTVHVVVTGGRPAVLTVDGEVQAELASGDEVVVEASPRVTCFARVQEQTYFYKTLVARLVPRNHAADYEYSNLGL